MSTARYLNNAGIKAYRKPLAEEAKKIQRAEIQDQSYALMRYRELTAARKERDRKNELLGFSRYYHHDMLRKLKEAEPMV